MKESAYCQVPVAPGITTVCVLVSSTGYWELGCDTGKLCTVFSIMVTFEIRLSVRVHASAPRGVQLGSGETRQGDHCLVTAGRRWSIAAAGLTGSRVGCAAGGGREARLALVADVRVVTILPVRGVLDYLKSPVGELHSVLAADDVSIGDLKQQRLNLLSEGMSFS